MGIDAKDLLAPPRSHTAKKRARPDEAVAVVSDDALALVPIEDVDDQQQQQDDDDALHW